MGNYPRAGPTAQDTDIQPLLSKLIKHSVGKSNFTVGKSDNKKTLLFGVLHKLLSLPDHLAIIAFPPHIQKPGFRPASPCACQHHNPD